MDPNRGTFRADPTRAVGGFAIIALAKRWEVARGDCESRWRDLAKPRNEQMGEDNTISV